MTYEYCRYHIPSSLLASQMMKKSARARKKAMVKNPLTYQDLLDRQEYLVATKAVAQQTAANRSTALRSFLRANSVNTADIVGAEMRDRYPEAIERFVETLKSTGKLSRSISNTKAATKSWREMVAEDDASRALEAGLPTPFQLKLKECLSGILMRPVCTQAGIPYDMLLGWLKGKVPRATNSHFLARLESFLSMERGSLALLAGVSHAPRLRPELGDAPPNAYRESLAALTSLPYWFKPAPGSPMRSQWATFMSYKTDAEADGLERSNQGQWRLSALPYSRTTDSKWYMFLDEKEVSSADAGWAKVGGFLGWLGLSAEKGGMSFPEQSLHTMAWFAVPKLVKGYLDWRRVRAGNKYSGSAPEFLGFVESLMRAEVGYFPQNPWLRETLPEAYRTSDWLHMCAKAMSSSKKVGRTIRGEVEISRDPFAPIEHIIDLEKPMEALVDMVRRMRADRPVGNMLMESIWARDLLLIKLLASNPLRIRQFAHMTWKSDNTGNLYQKGDGSWWIRWKKKFFKNRLGAAGDLDYDSPVQQTVWQEIERYLFKFRTTLMTVQCNWVFIRALERIEATLSRLSLGNRLATGCES